jgi:hypothetical protein
MTSSPGPRRDPLGLLSGGEGVIIGTVVCGAVIATSAGKATNVAQLVAAIVASVTVYALAHVHAEVVGSAVSHGRHPKEALPIAVRRAVPMLLASLVPLLVLVVTAAFGATLRTSGLVALLATTGLLGLYSFLAAHRRGLDLVPGIISALAGCGLGVLLILLKTLLK